MLCLFGHQDRVAISLHRFAEGGSEGNLGEILIWH
jgi:hypothetical protein